MLVLSRQHDETICVGDDIRVTVVAIRGDKVRIGIEAPNDVAVHRKEVYDSIKRERPNEAVRTGITPATTETPSASPAEHPDSSIPRA